MLANFGVTSIISIMTHLVFIALAWWALQCVNYEKFLRSNRVVQARVLFILVTIMIGTSVGNFFLNYLTWSQQLPYLFK